MQELILNGASWTTSDDVYDAFFRAVGAPEWHGRNFNALRDSISTGSINQVEVPYRLVIKNYGKICSAAKRMADDFIELIHELAAEGCRVEIHVEARDGGSSPALPDQVDYSGMTVNERLSSAGIMADWDAAAKSRNRKRMIALLCRVGLADQAEQIADAILSNPKGYGF
jgi:RNAse (barnase) inhibitor barstar